jgi:hypothetical protein
MSDNDQTAADYEESIRSRARDELRDEWDEEMRRVLAACEGKAEITSNDPPWRGDLFRKIDEIRSAAYAEGFRDGKNAAAKP